MGTPEDLVIQEFLHSAEILAAPNVQFQGQTIAMDFSFKNGQFIGLFTATKSFQIDTLLRINNAPLLPPLNFTGSGFLEDYQGGALGPTIALQASPVEDPDSQTGVDLLLRPVASNAVPGDAYGFHLDLTLPDSPGFGFGRPAGGVTFDGNIFGIGPGDIPRDIRSGPWRHPASPKHRFARVDSGATSVFTVG